MYRKKKNMIKLSGEREHQSEQAKGGGEDIPAWCSLQPSPVPSSMPHPKQHRDVQMTERKQ